MKELYKVNVLGTEYTIVQKTVKEDPALKKYDGMIDYSIKQIVIAEFTRGEFSLHDIEAYEQKCIRHELVHAFLYESGLSVNSDWAGNEEMIDWIAIQIYKMADVMRGCEVGKE